VFVLDKGTKSYNNILDIDIYSSVTTLGIVMMLIHI
jgi:hypothetical protein